MPVIAPIDRAHAPTTVAQQLEAVQRALGLVPNLVATLAQAPAALDAYLQFSGALAKGRLDAKTRERIALTTAQLNACDYCLSAHTAIGKHAGLTSQEIDAARDARGATPRESAIAQFVRRLVDTRGRVDAAELAAVRAAGLSDGDVIEVVVNVALNLLTNYVNHVAGTDIDFPIVRSVRTEASAAVAR